MGKRAKHKAKASKVAIKSHSDGLKKRDAIPAIEVMPANNRSSRFGQVNRLNRDHWNGAHGQSINNDLATNLDSLQAWCAYEYSTNPEFEGVVNTFKGDVVGKDGPQLQVETDSDSFEDAVESAYQEVMDDPDPSHRFHGIESMKTWVHGLMLAGSYVNVLTNVDRPGGQLSFGWRSIHARRLNTPANFAGDENVAFGLRLHPKTGAIVEAYIDKPQRNGEFSYQGLEYETIPAAALQHCFIPIEPEQLTGYPMMASTLDTAADMRDLKHYVLESMKNAAANSPYLHTKNIESVIKPDPIPSSGIRFEKGEVAVAPKGWEWLSAPSDQPSAQFEKFYNSLAAELGRPIHMPLLVVLLTAADANFASAQYEGTVYADGIAAVQGFIQRRSLNPIITKGIIPELVLRRQLKVPKKFNLVWTWNVPAHANIEKLMRAIETAIKLGIISEAHGAAMLGKNWEQVVSSRKKCKADLEKAGLPPTPLGNGGTPAKDDADNEDSNPKGGRRSVDRFANAA